MAPGILFGLAVVANELRLRVDSTIVAPSYIQVTSLLAGAIGLITTPVALTIAWFRRASLPLAVKALIWLAAFGFVAFILSYVWNPAFH